MSKITIVIEDNDNGIVSVKADPSAKEMARMAQSGKTLSPAFGYAVALMNKALSISKMAKQVKNESKIIQPIT